MFISSYFGDTVNINCNKSCDNCYQNVCYREVPALDDIKKLVMCLQAIHFLIKEPSSTLLVKTFVGSRCKMVKNAKMDQINEHGLGSGLTSSNAEDLTQVAFSEEIIEEKVPFNEKGRGKLSYILPVKNALNLIRGSYQKQLFVDRK